MTNKGNSCLNNKKPLRVLKAIIINKCSRCKKNIKADTGFYIQKYERANRGNRESGFLCNKCNNSFYEWVLKK